MKKIIKCISLFFLAFSLFFVSINKSSAKAYSSNTIYEEVVLEKDNDKLEESKKLSPAETAGIVICGILVSVGIGFSIYWFILKENKGEKKKNVR